MRNISLVLNIILVLAVAYLYYLHFKKTDSQDNTFQAPKIIPVSGAGIVYVNSDSLLSEYLFYKNEKDGFEKAQDKIQSELKSQSDRLQSEVETYQQQAVGMTDMERAQKEEQLAMKQQQLMQRKDELINKLDEDQAKSSEELYMRLNNYLKKYNEGKNYNYVLGYQKGGGILFANDSLNITGEVIEGLNKEYKNEQGK
jgi:outer membrane protein